MKVLIAEDNLTSRHFLKTQLTNWGYDVTIVPNGTDAWEVLQGNDPPSLAVLDWMMPGMSGVELCRKLRGTGRNGYTYVILLSARSEKRDIIAGLDSGADDYLTKPVDPAELQARLRVGERMTALYSELQQRIEEMELMLRRHNLLGELYRKQTDQTSTLDISDLVMPVQDDTPAGPQQERPAKHRPACAGTADRSRAARHKSMADVDDIIIRVFEEMGVRSARATDPAGLQGREGWELTAWTGMVLKETSSWLDLKVEISWLSAETLFRAALGTEPSAETDLLDAVGETLHIIQGHFKAAFDNAGISVIIPFIPKAIIAKNLPPLPDPGTGYRQYGYSAQGMDIVMSLLFSPAPIARKPYSEIQPSEMLVETIDLNLGKESAVLNAGLMLSPFYVKKINDVGMATGDKLTAAVVNPSPLAKALGFK